MRCSRRRTPALPIRTTCAALLAASAVVASPAAAGRDPWLVAHTRLGYPIFEPTQTLGLRLSRFTYPPCGHGKSKDSLYTSYGVYNMSPTGGGHGFELVEGSPIICANPAHFTPEGELTAGDLHADLGVYCAYPRKCPLADGYRNGFTLYWTRQSTHIQIDSARLTLEQLLEIATSLRQVSS